MAVDEVIIFKHVYKRYYFKNNYGLKYLILKFPDYLKEKKKNSFIALKDINLKVRKGEILGIMGPNGAGKSTILGLIAGIIKPDGGKILIQGRVAPLLELGAGFHPELTGIENVYLNAILLGMTKKEVDKKINKIIDFAEIGDFIEQPIRTYSSGMLARLGFSVAVHIEPEILLVDEILAVGDEKFQKKCISKMEEFKSKKITIIVVSHNKKQLLEMCNRIVFLNNGNIIGEEICC